MTKVSGSVLSTDIQSRRRGRAPEVQPVFASGEIERLFGLVEKVFLPTEIADMIGRVVQNTHPMDSAPERVRTYVKYGASPRAAIGLAEAVRVRALMHGKPSVGAEDVRALAKHVLGHRIALDYRAKLDGVSVWTLLRTSLSRRIYDSTFGFKYWCLTVILAPSLVWLDETADPGRWKNAQTEGLIVLPLQNPRLIWHRPHWLGDSFGKWQGTPYTDCV